MSDTSEKIDLSKAVPGDRFERRDGEVVEFKGAARRGVHLYRVGMHAYAKNGMFWGNGNATHIDLIRKLPPEIPTQPQEDPAAPTPLSEGETDTGALEAGDLVTRKQLRQLLQDIAALQGRIEALEGKMDAPTKPEPPKSYARYLNCDGHWPLSSHGGVPKGTIYRDDPSQWVLGPPDWLNDEYPIQDTFAQEKG